MRKRKFRANKWEFLGREASGGIWIRSTSTTSKGSPLRTCSEHGQRLSFAVRPAAVSGAMASRAGGMGEKGEEGLVLL